MATVVTTFLNNMDAGIVSFSTASATSVAKSARTPFMILSAVSVILWGLSVAANMVEEPFLDGLKRYLKIILVIACALNMGIYNGLIAHTIFAAPNELAAVFLHGTNTGANTLIDNALEQGNQIAIAYKDQGGYSFSGIFWYLSAFFVWGFVGVACAWATALILFAHFGLAILVGIGPLAILCYPFKTTRSLFDGWVKQTLTVILSYVFVSVAISIMFAVWRYYLDTALGEPGNGLSSFLGAFIAGGAGLYMLYKASLFGAAIAGGWEMDGQGAISWTAGKALSGAGAGFKLGAAAFRNKDEGNHRGRGRGNRGGDRGDQSRGAGSEDRNTSGEHLRSHRHDAHRRNADDGEEAA